MVGTRRCDLDIVRSVEQATARNLADYVATQRQLFPDAGADCIAVAGGIAAFTGIDSPLTTVKGAGPRLTPADLDEIESFFHTHGVVTPIVEMAPALTPESRQLLLHRGYQVVGQEDVVTAVADGPTPGRVPHSAAIAVDDWLAVSRRVLGAPDGSVISRLIVSSARLPRAQLYGVRDRDRWIAGAQSVTYDEVVIFGNDATLPDARRKGAQTALIQDRLAAVPAGALATAEVAPDSGSERNYLRCGFRIAYTREHFALSSRRLGGHG